MFFAHVHTEIYFESDRAASPRDAHARRLVRPAYPVMVAQTQAHRYHWDPQLLRRTN